MSRNNFQIFGQICPLRLNCCKSLIYNQQLLLVNLTCPYFQLSGWIRCNEWCPNSPTRSASLRLQPPRQQLNLPHQNSTCPCPGKFPQSICLQDNIVHDRARSRTHSEKLVPVLAAIEFTVAEIMLESNLFICTGRFWYA